MIKNHFLTWLLVFALVISGCSIEINQPTETTPSPFPSVISPTQPNPAPTSSLPTRKVLVTWGSLNLTGKLVYLDGTVEGNNFIMEIEVLDLVTGDLVTVYKAPANTYIYYLTISPDNKQLIMSYSPPIPKVNPTVYQALYILPMDGSATPQLLFTPPAKEDQFIQVEWSPDGKYIYFTHVNYRIPFVQGQRYPVFDIYRMAFPNGQPEKITADAYWPRLSPDSSKLLYVMVDPFSFTNQIYVADPDGSNAHQVALTGHWQPDIKDAPIFSPDGQSIIFSAPVPTPSYEPNWFDKLMGVRVAKADGTIPSDWWSVPVIGGGTTRLTNLQTLGLFASISPDHQHIASLSQDNIFVMNPDGSGLTILIPNVQGVIGTISWIP